MSRNIYGCDYWRPGIKICAVWAMMISLSMAGAGRGWQYPAF